jgi:hypothetical protein
VRPFTIDVPQRTLGDLAERLGRTLWPRDSQPPAWSEGTDVGFLGELTACWRSGFDWRAQERSLGSRLEEPGLLADDIRAFFKELR